MDTPLKVRRKRRGRCLSNKIFEYGELFDIDITIIAQERASGDYEVFQPLTLTMPPTIEILGQGPITIESALNEEKNLINWASYGPATNNLYQEIWEQRDSVAALVKHHMALRRQDKCIVLPPHNWIRGSFNVCIFVEVNSSGVRRKVVFRCPLPHKLAEARYPGSIDEKSSCEAGAYVWVEENCPEIRSPHLFGFGFMDGRHVGLPFRRLFALSLIN
ncbi:hypothetical protein HYQ44_020319 [Verticillium longisporum]|nr:hypothetical protein HYQ44_020319 [Verticillium longisporum]